MTEQLDATTAGPTETGSAPPPAPPPDRVDGEGPSVLGVGSRVYPAPKIGERGVNR